MFRDYPIGIAIMGLDYGLSESMSSARLLGYTEQELTNLTFVDVTYREDVDKDIELAQKLFTGELPNYHLEKRYVKKNKVVVWIHLTATVLRNQNGQIVCGLAMIKDITERKVAERQLRESQHFLQQAQQVAQLGSWHFNSRTNHVRWSDHLYCLFGLEPGSHVTFEKFLACVHPDDRHLVQSAVQTSLRENRLFDYEFRAIRPDGTIWTCHSRAEVLCDSAGKPFAMIGIAQDITERKQAEEALRANEQALASRTDRTGAVGPESS